MPTFFQLSIPCWKTFIDPGECHPSDLGNLKEALSLVYGAKLFENREVKKDRLARGPRIDRT